MIYQYRAFGRIPFWKTFIVYMFIFYVTTAYYMVILPLPEDHTAVVAYAATPQLVPFNFLREIAAEVNFSIADPGTWIQTLKCSDVYEAFFNLLLTVPLGLFLRYFFRCRWWQALLIGFGMTLFYETSQLTGLWGLYEHPYRLFDVDDLMVNTLGAMVGFWIADPLTRHLPDIDQLNEESLVESAIYTTFTRRLLAFVMDLAPIAVVFAIIDVLAPELLEDLTSVLTVATVSTGLVFMLVPAVTNGATLGDKILQLRIVRPDGSPASRWQCVARYALLFWVFLLLPGWAYVLLPDMVEGSTVSPELFGMALAALYGVWALTVAVRAIRSARRHPFIMLNGMISHTRIMSLEQAEALQKVAHAAHAGRDDTQLPAAPSVQTVPLTQHGERR
jgi:glycopeptide antibiotics resistance protein